MYIFSWLLQNLLSFSFIFKLLKKELSDDRQHLAFPFISLPSNNMPSFRLPPLPTSLSLILQWAPNVSPLTRTSKFFLPFSSRKVWNSFKMRRLHAFCRRNNVVIKERCSGLSELRNEKDEDDGAPFVNNWMGSFCKFPHSSSSHGTALSTDFGKIWTDMSYRPNRSYGSYGTKRGGCEVYKYRKIWEDRACWVGDREWISHLQFEMTEGLVSFWCNNWYKTKKPILLRDGLFWIKTRRRPTLPQ